MIRPVPGADARRVPIDPSTHAPHGDGRRLLDEFDTVAGARLRSSVEPINQVPTRPGEDPSENPGHGHAGDRLHPLADCPADSVWDHFDLTEISGDRPVDPVVRPVMRHRPTPR